MAVSLQIQIQIKIHNASRSADILTVVIEGKNFLKASFKSVFFLVSLMAALLTFKICYSIHSAVYPQLFL